MNSLTRELQSCLAELTSEDDGHWTARFVFSPAFAGFRGHFPGRPVLPGVCMVQAVTTALAMRRKSPVRLQRIASAKWFAPAGPGVELRFDCQERRDASGAWSVRARITSGETKIADLALLIAEPGRGGGHPA